jgi:hypothetical protein
MGGETLSWEEEEEEKDPRDLRDEGIIEAS